MHREGKSCLLCERSLCPEPRVGLGGCRQPKKSYTQFGSGETGDPNVRSTSNHLHGCRK